MIALWLSLLLGLTTLARAEDPEPAEPVTQTAVEAAPAAAMEPVPATVTDPQAVTAPHGEHPVDDAALNQKVRTTKKGKRRIEKEAEGTEALGRFEADTVIKSRYTHNGEPLEVDPD